MTSPTIQSFMEKVGKPSLVFTIPSEQELSIPHGLLACCREIHQQHCRHFIEASIVGATYTLVLPDGGEKDNEHQLIREGDVLANPGELLALTRAIWLVIEETARRLGGNVKQVTVAVFSLGIELATEWRHLQEQAQQQAPEHPTDEGGWSIDADAVSQMPIVSVDELRMTDDEGNVEPQDRAIARLVMDGTFVPVAAYDASILTVPFEIGHDAQRRYIMDEVFAPQTEPLPGVTP